MIDMPPLFERLSNWAEFARRYWALEAVPDPLPAAIVALAGGLLLALWGARLLRGVYILAFMAAGAAIGVRFARQIEVDLLVGFVLGGGLAALIGHLLYRWWIGLTAALCAVAAVAALGAPWIPRQAESFADALLMQATGRNLFAATSAPSDVPAAPPEDQPGPVIDWLSVADALQHPEGQPRPTPLAVLGAWCRSVWAAIPGQFRNVGLLAGLAGLLGLALGVVLPRFTAIVGTSAVGVAALVVGAAYLMSRHAPGLWRFMESEPIWFYGFTGLMLVVSLAFQARRGKLRHLAPPVAATPDTG